MTSTIETRLSALGLGLPQPAAPAANYVPFCRTGPWVHVSGQIPIRDGHVVWQGGVPAQLNVEQGMEAARLCALNILAQVKVACDDNLDNVLRVVKLNGYVACPPGFRDQPKIINGASDLMVELFGEAGRHARSAVGVAALPLGVPVEIDALFQIQEN